MSNTFYRGDRVKALGAPRATAPSGCEADRELQFADAIGTVEQTYGALFRIVWDDAFVAESGWRRREDFEKIEG